MASRPVSFDFMPKRSRTITSSSLEVKLSGLNSVTSTAPPIASKKPTTSSLPFRIPYHGTASEDASAAQSTSSVSCSRIAGTSPLPNAS